MFDINGLKTINDVQGHEVGDKAIKEAARILKKVFNDDRLFQIGGDEFVVILKCDEEGIKEHFGLFSKMLEESDIEKGDMPVAMSKGYAIYDKEKDRTYKDTFSRADDAMYADKKAYYMTHEDRRKK